MNIATTVIYTLSLHDALPIYQFVDQARFQNMVKQNELLEWATVFDNSYGTPRTPVEAALSSGQDVLDRKSTRLNSSHVRISYAVFCLKKKTPGGAPARSRDRV